MSFRYVSDAESLALLVSEMSNDDRVQYNSFGHLQVESSFVGRNFVIYRSRGATSDPIILDVITIADFGMDDEKGGTSLIKNQAGEQLVLSHVPSKLWNYPVYMAISPNMTVRWGAYLDNRTNKFERSLAWGVLIKTANKATFRSSGNTYMLPLNKFLDDYPLTPIRLK